MQKNKIDKIFNLIETNANQIDNFDTSEFLPEYFDTKELARNLPVACSLLGINQEDCVIFADKQHRRYMIDENLEDIPVKALGICNAMPFVYSGKSSGYPNFDGYGSVLYSTKIDNLNYVTINYTKNYNYILCFIVVEKKKFSELMKYFENKNEELEKKYLIDSPPILPDGFLDEVIKNSIDFLLQYEKFSKFGVRPARGIILRGEPGNGKTMTCKWIQYLAKKNELTIANYTTADIEEAYRENTLSKLMTSQNVIFFDDVDISFFSRKKAKAVIQKWHALCFLQWMDSAITKKVLPEYLLQMR